MGHTDWRGPGWYQYSTWRGGYSGESTTTEYIGSLEAFIEKESRPTWIPAPRYRIGDLVYANGNAVVVESMSYYAGERGFCARWSYNGCFDESSLTHAQGALDEKLKALQGQVQEMQTCMDQMHKAIQTLVADRRYARDPLLQYLELSHAHKKLCDAGEEGGAVVEEILAQMDTVWELLSPEQEAIVRLVNGRLGRTR